MCLHPRGGEGGGGGGGGGTSDGDLLQQAGPGGLASSLGVEEPFAQAHVLQVGRVRQWRTQQNCFEIDGQ